MQEDTELHRSLGRVEGKLDFLVMQLTEHIKKDEIAWQKVYSLEKKFVWFSGAAATAMILGSALLRKIGLIT